MHVIDICTIKVMSTKLYVYSVLTNEMATLPLHVL